ncbi:hypothetical protein U1Q18_004635 [Sarracenia purpurea var. burkii]
MASPLRDEKDGFEFKLALNGKVLDGEVILPIVCQTLVERGVFLLGNLLWLAQPDGFLLVDQLPFMAYLLNLLLL